MNELDGRPGSRVDPAFVFGCSLLFSLVLSYPSLRASLDGRIDIVVAGMRYLVALGFSWVALFGLFTLVSTYGREVPPKAPPALPEAPAPELHPMRRQDDVLDLRDAPVEEAPAPAGGELPDVTDVDVISPA